MGFAVIFEVTSQSKVGVMVGVGVEVRVEVRRLSCKRETLETS